VYHESLVPFLQLPFQAPGRHAIVQTVSKVAHLLTPED
jgi:hypothetical protein